MTIVSRQIYSCIHQTRTLPKSCATSKTKDKFICDEIDYDRKNLLSNNRSNLRSTFVSKLRRSLSLPRSNEIKSMNHIEQVQIMRKTRQQTAAVAIFTQKSFPWILKVFEIFIVEHATEKSKTRDKKSMQLHKFNCITS